MVWKLLIDQVYCRVVFALSPMKTAKLIHVEKKQKRKRMLVYGKVEGSKLDGKMNGFHGEFKHQCKYSCKDGVV